MIDDPDLRGRLIPAAVQPLHKQVSLPILATGANGCVTRDGEEQRVRIVGLVRCSDQFKLAGSQHCVAPTAGRKLAVDGGQVRLDGVHRQA